MVANSSGPEGAALGPSEHDPVASMLRRARNGSQSAVGDLLQMYQNYLRVLATTQLHGRLKRRLNPSDLVQETMLAAHRDFEAFRGQGEAELLAWLRQIVINNVRRAVDVHIHAKKRDLRREVALDTPVSQPYEPPQTMANLIADRGNTPSEVCGRKEIADQLSTQLAMLKPEYREVIVLRNLHGLSFDEIANRMQRSPGSTRMLWLRAIEKARSQLAVDSGQWTGRPRSTP